MKRILLHVSLMIVTFVLGLAVDWLTSRTKVEHTLRLEPPKLDVSSMIGTYTPVLAPLSATPTPHLIFDYDQEKYYLDADYVVIGQQPKDFAEFKSFALWSASNGEQHSGGLDLLIDSIDPSGTYDVEHAGFVLVTQRRLFFATTEGKNGFAYRFDGEFLRTNMVAVTDENIPVLRGTLTKMKNGRRVAESVMKFGVLVHGC